jgi:HemK-related putative methylase
MESGKTIQPSAFLSIPRQADRLDERRASELMRVTCAGMDIIVDQGVYHTSGDSELMAECVRISADDEFLEVGCGTGVVSIALAKQARRGTAVDINARAVENTRRNAEANDVSNLTVLESNVFEKVEGTFDVIVCNPPYTNHDARDPIDRMFWDPQDEMKRAFFERVGDYLKPDGRIYFGWANFADIDVELPLNLAEQSGFALINTYEKPHHKGGFSFYVFEFEPR